ncbi:hypothetical protein HY637_03935 [Candidatus Woesearchaeota archaeon]|nr:hypothetical protein [Candidatus Woesearchaeota archaeon]
MPFTKKLPASEFHFGALFSAFSFLAMAFNPTIWLLESIPSEAIKVIVVLIFFSVSGSIVTISESTEISSPSTSDAE